MKRRDLLKSAPAAGLGAILAGATPLAASQLRESMVFDPIPDWFWEWKKNQSLWEDACANEVGEDCLDILDERNRIGDAILTTAATSLAGLRAQVELLMIEHGHDIEIARDNRVKVIGTINAGLIAFEREAA